MTGIGAIMHFLRTQAFSLDETEAAVDLDQSPAEIVILSFSDNDLSAVAAAWDEAPMQGLGLRLANLARLRHPFSVDTYVDKLAAKARFVIVRLLGGLDYWRYGIDELAAAARRHGFAFAALPGDNRDDARLDAGSTLAQADLRRLSAYFQHGGPDNIRNMLAWIADRLDGPKGPKPCHAPWQHPAPVPPAGRCEAACHAGSQDRGHALILFYRAALLAGDMAPILTLADALRQRGFATTAIYVTSLKDPDVAAYLATLIAREPPDLILNTTGFSARRDEGESVLDCADVPVFQVILAGASEAQWRNSRRGLSATDLAMNVVLPEMDGRIVTRAISFKAEAETRADLEFTRIVHRPVPSRVKFVADLARAWVDLRHKPRAARRIACILSDYPMKVGRSAYAVGLDAPASVFSIAQTLSDAGYTIENMPTGQDLVAALETKSDAEIYSFAAYRAALAALPPGFVERLVAVWGEPEADEYAGPTGFRFSIVRGSNFIVALQPDRGRRATRKSDYHDSDAPPCHAYVAFYLWLRKEAAIDAMIHCGTHGTLEWLPGKAIALDEDCAPEVLVGTLPVVYPFIVNNPGEAAQAKRRIAAVTIGHMTPPLTEAGSHGVALELEALFDEFAAAEALDPRRAKILGKLILERAFETGLAQDSGLNDKLDPDDALRRIDAWLCDIKEMRIGDGLHIFGRSPQESQCDAMLAALRAFSSEVDAGSREENASEQKHRAPLRFDRNGKGSGAGNDSFDQDDVKRRIMACGAAERTALIAALDGNFVPPGPAGAPSRGRFDVLPTGRNLYTIDPRGVPTRTAWEIGRRTAREVMSRYAQDHGEWPKSIVLDLWGSAMMRTGGDDLAQAFALMGVKPLWDNGSNRVSGFEVLTPAQIEWSRVDVTLRISGLFRDVFPTQIALFDEAVRAVAALDEDEATNPLATEARQGRSTARIFGSAPGSYGIGLGRNVLENASASRADLGEAYLAASAYAYGAHGDGAFAPAGFRDRVANAQAFVHVQDMSEHDILDSDAYGEHEGGFATAAAHLGNEPAIYHADSTRSGETRVRTITEEIARVVRGRAANPRWIAGQMRHGHRGAAEIAETIDNLFTYAALTDAVASRHFDIVFDATLGSADVRAFLLAANPQAARAIAARFEQALQRGFWQNRRNSTLSTIAEIREHTG
jgi:cobaltochelatase CobN